MTYTVNTLSHPLLRSTAAVEVARLECASAQLERQISIVSSLTKRCDVLQASVSVLHRVADAIADPTAFEKQLEGVFTECVELCGFSTGSLFLRRGASNALTFESHHGANRGQAEQLYGAPALLESVCRANETIVMPDRDCQTVDQQTLLRNCDAAAVQIIPLRAAGHNEGLMVLTSDAPFTDMQQTLGRSLASQLGEAIGLMRALVDRGEAQARYRVIMDNAVDAIGLCDLDGVIREVNEAWLGFFGVSRERAIGSSFIDFVDSDTRDQTASEFAALKDRGVAFLKGARFLRSDGTCVEVDVSCRAAQIGDRRVCVAIGRDVTQQNLLQAQLRQMQKIEAVGMLVGGVAHDFNNLLAVILANCEFLAEDLPADSPSRADVVEVRTAADRAVTLTRQLTAFSRKQVLEPKVVSLNNAVIGIWKMVQRIIGEDIKLETRLSPDAGNIFVDSAQLEQIVMNLAVNARDAMPTGGTLCLESSNVELDSEYEAHHLGAKRGHYVLFVINDSGTGMTAEVKQHLFEPFFTTKEKGRGTGLGLSTVFGIVKQSGGYINVYSELGHGSVFKIYLPRVDLPVGIDEPIGHDQGDDGQGETVLLLEDEVAVRNVVERLLTSCDYHVLVATNEVEALAIARSYNGPIDLLLSDVVMPDATGPAIAAELTALRPTLKVVFMSGFATHTIVTDGTLQPGVHFIQKPFTQAAIAKKLRNVLDAGKPQV